MQDTLGYFWWAAQWPILIVGLLAAFTTLLYLAPNVEQRALEVPQSRQRG